MSEFSEFAIPVPPIPDRFEEIEAMTLDQVGWLLQVHASELKLQRDICHFGENSAEAPHVSSQLS